MAAVVVQQRQRRKQQEPVTPPWLLLRMHVAASSSCSRAACGWRRCSPRCRPRCRLRAAAPCATAACGCASAAWPRQAGRRQPPPPRRSAAPGAPQSRAPAGRERRRRAWRSMSAARVRESNENVQHMQQQAAHARAQVRACMHACSWQAAPCVSLRSCCCGHTLSLNLFLLSSAQSSIPSSSCGSHTRSRSTGMRIAHTLARRAAAAGGSTVRGRQRVSAAAACADLQHG